VVFEVPDSGAEIGLFVGAIVLCIGYKLFLAWLEGPVAAKEM